MSAGDHSMAYGDVAEGGNQRNQIVLMRREYHGTGNHIFRAEFRPSYHRVYTNGEYRGLAAGNVDSKKASRKYGGGLFRKGPELTVLDVFTGGIDLTVPLTVSLSDGTYVDCIILVNYICDPDSSNLEGLLNSDYAISRNIPGGEYMDILTAESLSKILRNRIAGTALEPLAKSNNPRTDLGSIRAALLDINRRDGVFATLGLHVQSVDFRCGESAAGRLSRQINEMTMEAELDRAEARLKMETNLIKIEFAKKEYSAMTDLD